MKMAAAHAIANLVQGDALNPDHIISNVLDAKVPVAVAKAVARKAIDQKVAKELAFSRKTQSKTWLRET